MVKGILILVGVALILFVGMQLVPVNRTNPPVLTEPNWDSPQTQALAQRACMDCHSNQTNWRWYTYMAPASWLVAHDVSEGRRELNLSQLNADPTRNSRMAQRIQRAIQSGNMPPAQYLIMHPEAQLTPQEKQLLETGLQKTLAQPPLTK
jgi:hypothetical protein